MKHTLSPALVLISFTLFFATTLGRGQTAGSPSSASNPSLPNAPSATQETTCTERKGKPCPQWVHKLVGQYPPSAESPDSQLVRDPSTVHFWTYRGWDEPPLRNNKQVFHSKLFVATQVGGAIAMIVACRNNRSGENWASEVPAVAGIFGMDYLQFRFIGGPNAMGAPIYEMIHYGLAGTK